MRRAALLVLAAVAVVAAIAAVVSRGDAPAPRVGALTMVGDSLNVGVEPHLREALAGWTIDADNVVGRGSDDGIAALERRGGSVGPVVVVSLGTNDPQTDVDGFRTDVRRVLELAGPDRCVVWATIARDGPNAGFNQVLRDEADGNRSLRLVEWHEMVAAHPDWLTGDRVHGTPAGYRGRAVAIADVARECLPASGAA